MLGYAQLSSGPFPILSLGLLGRRLRSRGRGRLQSLRSTLHVDILAADGSRRQHGHDVAPHLRETTVHEEPTRRRPVTKAQLTEAQTADQRRPPAENAQLAVVHGQSDEIDWLIQNRPLRGDYDTL
jgi:hypothetical protein